MRKRQDKRLRRIKYGEKTGGPNKAPPKRVGYIDGDVRKGHQPRIPVLSAADRRFFGDDLH